VIKNRLVHLFNQAREEGQDLGIEHGEGFAVEGHFLPAAPGCRAVTPKVACRRGAGLLRPPTRSWSRYPVPGAISWEFNLNNLSPRGIGAASFSFSRKDSNALWERPARRPRLPCRPSKSRFEG
jgi:hypothetical protein